MAEKSRILLPTLIARGPASDGPPSLEAARDALGGATGLPAPASLLPGAGDLVAYDDPRHGRVPGVVVHADRTTLDVWIGEGMIARVERGRATASVDPMPSRWDAVASDARRFASLAHGDRVRCAVRGANPGEREGRIVEKCRWGALVEVRERRVLAVGFRSLAPIAS